MYELIQLTENDYYIDCPAKIGIVRVGGGDVVLIDGGNDKDAGKKVLRVLEANGWKPIAILNTHSHADHIGGNALLQERTGCRVFAKGIEAVYASYPILEPIGLYGGLPLADLKHKFLLAQPCGAEELPENGLPGGLTVLPLPGHSPDMVGFLTPDGTAYIGDCVSSAQTLEKYGIVYTWDPDAAKQSLGYVKTVSAKRFVPAHADVTEDIGELADVNIKAIDGVFEMVLSLCAEGVTFEKLLKKTFDRYGMQASAQQYALIGSTLRSYLSDLHARGEIAFDFVGNEMLWKKV